jgi:hypothetical protein
LTGEKVYKADFSSGTGNAVDLDFDLPAGIYFVKIQSGNDVEVKKFVIE